MARARAALDRILFIPAGNPPHKRRSTHSSFEDRARMTEIACEGIAGFEVSRMEEASAGGYSIDTITRVKQSLAPGDGLYFLIGADAFAEVHTWWRSREVLAAVTFLVVSRPGFDYPVPDGASVERIDGVKSPASSSSIRERLARGEAPEELDARVMAYICERGLYGAHGPALRNPT